MNIYQLIDLLEEEIEDSASVMFSSNKKKVDLERIDEIISEMRRSIPEEIRQAEMIRQEKQHIYEDAKIQADAMLRDAERRARDMVETSEITRLANEHAAEIIEAAQKNAREVRLGAKAYAEDILADLEKYFAEYIDVIRRNKEAMAGQGKN